MIQVKNLLPVLKNWSLLSRPKTIFILSPNQIDVLFVKLAKKQSVVISQQSISGKILERDTLNTSFLLQVINRLNLSPRDVGVSLNLPAFFTNTISVPVVAGQAAEAVLNLKIQSEFPLPLEKYIHVAQELPRTVVTGASKSFLVLFYQRALIESIQQTFLRANLVPVVLEPLFVSLLRTIPDQLAIDLQKIFIVVVVYAETITGFIYDAGVIKNTFTELVDAQSDLARSLERFLQFSLQRFSLEQLKQNVGGLLLLSPKSLSLQVELPVINLSDLTKEPIERLLAIGVSRGFSRQPFEGGRLSLVPSFLAQPLALVMLARLLMRWTIVALILGGLTLAGGLWWGRQLNQSSQERSNLGQGSRVSVADLQGLARALKTTKPSSDIPKLVSVIGSIDLMVPIQSLIWRDNSIQVIVHGSGKQLMPVRDLLDRRSVRYTWSEGVLDKEKNNQMVTIKILL